jgi:prepilin peptidase CpaA
VTNQRNQRKGDFLTFWKWLALITAAGAVVMDLAWRKILNEYLLAAAAASFVELIISMDAEKSLDFMLGCLVPGLLLSIMFYFRMMGAGDIKLLMLLGGMVGHENVLGFLLAVSVAGAVLAGIMMTIYGNWRTRFSYFKEYLLCCFKTQKRFSYRGEWQRGASIHFTIPVCIGVLLWIGGMI